MISGSKIRAARERKGLSQAQLAEMVGVSQPAIQNIEAGKTTKSRHMLDVLAALGLSDTANITELRSAPVYGVARAGYWIDFDDTRQTEFDQIPFVPGPWAKFSQFAYRVGGASMLKAGFREGDYVVCVPYGEARKDLTDRDIVIVERRDGHRRETALKRLRVSRAEVRLVSESDDPAFQEPLFFRSTEGVLFDPDDGITIEIIGLVIGKYTPISAMED